MYANRFRRARKVFSLGLFRTWQLLFNGIVRLGDHRGTQMSASMAYFGLLSVFPMMIVAVGVTGLLLDQESQASLVDFLLRELPLTSTGGRSEVEQLIDGVVNNSGAIGIAGALVLILTASALMGATRNALGVAFEEPYRRGVLRGKFVDVALVLGLGTVFIASFIATVTGRLNIDLPGAVGEALNAIISTGGVLLPIALAALVFAVLLHFLPVTRPSLADIWPGIVFAAFGYEVLKFGFSVYLNRFADYNAIYGSLGAVIAFLVFIYLASLIFLLGAEIAALWPRARAGEFDPGTGEDISLATRLRGFAIGLVSRGESTRD